MITNNCTQYLLSLQSSRNYTHTSIITQNHWLCKKFLIGFKTRRMSDKKVAWSNTNFSLFSSKSNSNSAPDSINKKCPLPVVPETCRTNPSWNWRGKSPSHRYGFCLFIVWFYIALLQWTIHLQIQAHNFPPYFYQLICWQLSWHTGYRTTADKSSNIEPVCVIPMKKGRKRENTFSMIKDFPIHKTKSTCSYQRISIPSFASTNSLPLTLIFNDIDPAFNHTLKYINSSSIYQ